MSIYRVKTGVDQPLVDLVVMAPQPASTGVQATRRVFAGDGTVYDQGAYIELTWTMLGDAADYTALLTQFGLHVATTAAVTVYARDEFWQWSRFNGLAVRPQMGADARWTNYFPRGITIIVRNLSKLWEP